MIWILALTCFGKKYSSDSENQEEMNCLSSAHLLPCSPAHLLVLIAALIFSGCNLSSILSSVPYENYALFAEANQAELCDGNLKTIARVPDSDTRQFTIKFVDPKHIRKIVIHNHNLYWFKIEYWNERLQKWKTLESIQQRRNIEGISRRIQKKYEFKNLNFLTDKLRIDVSRTVDDRVVSKTSVKPDEHIVNVRRSTLHGYREYYRVLKRSPASLREIEIYGMPESEQLF